MRKVFQYKLINLVILITCVGVILGAGRGHVARDLLVLLSLAVIAVGLALGTLLLAWFVVALVQSVSLLPVLVRRLWFRKKWSKLRPGLPSKRVKFLLGRPTRVDGFGDRTYWSYLVAGRRYTLALDPRFLVRTYSDGLRPDLQSSPST